MGRMWLPSIRQMLPPRVTSTFQPAGQPRSAPFRWPDADGSKFYAVSLVEVGFAPVGWIVLRGVAYLATQNADVSVVAVGGDEAAYQLTWSTTGFDEAKDLWLQLPGGWGWYPAGRFNARQIFLHVKGRVGPLPPACVWLGDTYITGVPINDRPVQMIRQEPVMVGMPVEADKEEEMVGMPAEASKEKETSGQAVSPMAGINGVVGASEMPARIGKEEDLLGHADSPKDSVDGIVGAVEMPTEASKEQSTPERAASPMEGVETAVGAGEMLDLRESDDVPFEADVDSFADLFDDEGLDLQFSPGPFVEAGQKQGEKQGVVASGESPAPPSVANEATDDVYEPRLALDDSWQALVVWVSPQD